MRHQGYFVLSIFLHGLALVGMLFFLKVDNDKIHDAITVDLDSAPVRRHTVTAEASSKRSIRSRYSDGSSSAKKMAIFGQSYTTNSQALNSNKLILEGKAVGFNDSSSYEAAADSFIADTDQWSYFQQVFEKIDQQLVFDSLLAQYNHFGYVYVAFEVGPDGRFIDKSVRVSAVDSILKVHALRALRKGLMEEFPRKKWNPKGERVWFQAKFEFVSGSEDMNFTKQRDFGKAKFIFRRASSEKPVPNDLKDQLLTGGISHDPFAMAERWEKYNKKKRLKDGGFDPFALYKADPDYNL